MADKGDSSLPQDNTKLLLMKEVEEKNILKQTLSQKDETIENLKRCLQMYQSGLKVNPFNEEVKPNVTEDSKESFMNNHGSLTSDHGEVKLDEIIIDDDVDDLVNFVNEDLLGAEDLNMSFDVDCEIIGEKLEDNIDIKDLARFTGFSFGGLAEEFSNDEVVSEIMSSPYFDDNVQVSRTGNAGSLNGQSVLSSLPQSKTSAFGKSMTVLGKTMGSFIPEDIATETTAEEEMATVKDKFGDMDVLTFKTEIQGVPPLGKMDEWAPKKEARKTTMKGQKWMVENNIKEHSSRKSKNLRPETLTKSDQSTSVLYKMFDCGKCGVSFPMDRKEVLNSFYKPGKPRCHECQPSPRDLTGKKTKFNFMPETSRVDERMGRKGIKIGNVVSKTNSETSRGKERMGRKSIKIGNLVSNTNSETSQTKERMGRKSIKISQLKTNSLTSQPLQKTKSRIQCEECGKQFPMGGEWKYKKHMEVHMKGKRQVPAKVDVKKAVEIIAERKEQVDDKIEFKKTLDDIVEMKDRRKEKSHVKIKIEANSCEVCQESFKYNSTLIAHMKTHQSKYPFRCNLCNKSFKRIDDMVSHGVKDHERRSVGRLMDLLGKVSN